MDLNSLPLFSRLTQRMGWLNQRQTVIAQNIANADTPGYRAKDVAPISFKDQAGAAQAGQLTQVRTNAGHLQGRSPAQPFKTEERAEGETSISGNGVVLEEQMIKLAETQMDYQTITNLYRKQVAMIKTAIGRT